MTIKLFAVVKTRQAFPGVLPAGRPLPAGSEGTVVMVFDTPRRGYEVEFCDEEGKTLTTLTVSEEQIEPA